MDRETLTNFYDKLKDELDEEKKPKYGVAPLKVGDGKVDMSYPGAIKFKNLACKEAEKLEDACNKNILVDIYYRIIPLDKEYLDKNLSVVTNDIDSMLKSKGCTATQYLQDACNKTNAPLLEFILRSSKGVGKKFLEEAEETLKDAQKNDCDVPAPEADLNDEEIKNQIVDVKKDDEYQTFIDKLKQKTVNKIVNDISKIINDKKEENNMTFNPKPEDTSVVESAMNYINYKLMKENVNITPEMNEEIMGIAIREATLNELDRVFNMSLDDTNINRRISLGHGSLITESVITQFKESGDVPECECKRFEPLYKEIDGNKYDVNNFEKVNADGTKSVMTDQEAKKVLDPEAYKSFKSR